MEKLKLAAGMTGEQKRYAVEAALLLGFQTETATFPVITADGEIPVPENMEELKALWKKSTGGTPEEYESASKHTGPIFDLDFRKEKGLETMLQKGDFLKDENQDLLPDVLDVKIVLPEDADDAVAEALCKAWERREQLRSPDKMRSWVAKITVNTALSMIQKRKWEELVESMDDYPTNEASGYPHSGIWHEIESLAEQDRTLVYLYYIYGFSQKEISAILNIPTGTVKSRLYAARQKLKNCR